jgi:hypothetical protein
VLPVLWGDEFIGRIDLKADRANQQLIVRNLTIESNLKQVKEVLLALGEKLKALATFNKVERVMVEQTKPRSLKTALNKIL